MEYTVELINVTKKFRNEKVLKEVTAHLEKGKIHGIVGNNGSGKTVLLKCICGFLFPDSGEIIVNGTKIGKNRDFPDNIGIIIENPGFLPKLSGIENLQLLASLNCKIGRKEIKEAMRKVGLEPHLKKAVEKYSLGMRQRLGIAQAIMEKPELLILDEPFNGLDKQTVADMHELLKVFREKGNTILLTSHNTCDIEMLCDTVWEMDGGILTKQ